jgi:16S rRNA (uracil1498-N3)-methyltransferase
MRLHRFYTPETVGDRSEATIENRELAHQIRNVFRLTPGDRLIIFDGSGSDYECAIASYAGDDRVALDVLGKSPSRYMPARRVWLFAAIVKKDNFETIVEKATELGVTDVVPVLAERSEKKGLNEERLRRIAREASEQSGRGDVPTIHPIMPLEEAVHAAAAQELEAVAFHTDGDPVENLDRGRDAAVFIGPEGGWSPDEIALFHANKIAVRCLGPQVLRAETATVAALSRVVFG